MKKVVSIIFILICTVSTLSYAHSGRTDFNGGHYDNSTGEYHYHHGYSAHQHVNGLCPYESDSEDLLPSKCQKCGNAVNPENGYYCFECGYELVDTSYLVSLVDGPADKTRSEYFKDVQYLESQIDNLKTQISNQHNRITSLNETIEEQEIVLEENKTSMYFFIILVIILTIYIIYIKYKANNYKELSNLVMQGLGEKDIDIAIKQTKEFYQNQKNDNN